MNFFIYDISFLIIFSLFLILFYKTHKKGFKKEGLLYLYRTKWGIKLINYVGGKYKKTLKFFSYISIILGYCLMAGILYFIGKIVWIYYKYPVIVKAIKVPPLIPLIPYLPKIFSLDFLPPFYFTYWIIVIAIIAIPHEFAHGIFAKFNKLKIKSTGFGFLGPFLAAFVEPDEKQMKKKPIFAQLSILSAGTFANIVTAVVFFIIMILFFKLMFVPVGVLYSYAYTTIPTETIQTINGINVEDYSSQGLLDLVQEKGGIIKIQTEDSQKYLQENNSLITQLKKENSNSLIVYYDAPAINNNLSGAIVEFEKKKITEKDVLIEEILDYNPGDEVEIKTKLNGEYRNYKIELGKNPSHENIGFLGITTMQGSESSGIMGKIYSVLGSFKDPSTYYEPKIDGLSLFIYDLLWWIVLISISVGLINMLPVGIFDGGKVFYLTVLGLTKSKKIAEQAFKFLTYFILFLALLLILFYFYAIFV